MEHARRGAAALSASNASTAVSEYTHALLEHPTSPDYFTQRSTAFTRLKPPRHDLALRDAEHAVLLAQKRQKRDKIQAAQQRRVIALYGAGRYKDAGFVLEKMERWRLKDNKKDKMENDIWRAKIEQNLKKVPSTELQAAVTVTEYPELELPTEAGTREMLRQDLNSDGTFNFGGVMREKEVNGRAADIEMASKGTTDNISSNNRPATHPSAVAPSSATAPLPNKFRHEWYQNTQSVIVTLYAKGVSKDKTEIDIQDDHVDISFPHPSLPSSTYQFSLEPLFALVDPAASTYKIMSTKIELILQKKEAGQKWPALENTAPIKTATDPNDTTAKAAIMSTLRAPASTNTTPSYPTSSRTGPKDWDKLATDLTAKKTTKKAKAEGSDSEVEGEEYDSDYGGDEVDGFFKKLYKGADDDTRRAMMKSYQESGGTALSTNWSEVGKGRVEPVKSSSDD